MLGAVAALVVVSLVALILLNAGDDGAGVVSDAGGTTTSVVPTSTTSTSTTTTLVAVTTTSVGPASGVGAPGATTTTADPGRVVTGQGAVLRGLTSPEVRAQAPATGCESLADPGWTATCAEFSSGGIALAALEESRTLPTGETARRAYVFRLVGDRQWRVVLRARDDTGSRFSAIRFQLGSASGRPDALFGFTARDGSSLAVDLVDSQGNVAVHRDLARGSARVTPGRLDTWRAATPGGTTYAHDVIQYVQGAWRIVASDTVPAAQVPPSHV